MVIFNEPLLVLVIFLMNPVWSAISVFSNAQFIMAMLIFWSLDLYYYRKSRINACFLIVEIIAIIVLFVLIFNAYLYVHQQLRYDPTYEWQTDLNTKYKEIFISIILVVSLIMMWIVYLAGKALSQIIKLGNREKMMKILNSIMVALGFFGLIVGAFQPIPEYSSLLLIFVSAFNFYIVLLQIMYSPTSSSLTDYFREKSFVCKYVL